MKTRMFLPLLLMMISAPAMALDGSTGTGKFDFRAKAKEKESSRWTLQEWLEQRDRNRMMDLWLSMNSASPYEFFLGGAYQDTTKITENPNAETRVPTGLASAGAYASLIGLEGFYENNSQERINQSGGSLNLRIMGNAVQGTHLSINYGYRSMTTNETSTETTVNQPFAGADLNIYLNRYFGLSGMYRYYIPADNDQLGSVSGNRTEGGLFIDFAALRVFGSWYSDRQLAVRNQVETHINRTGIMSGVKFFF